MSTEGLTRRRGAGGSPSVGTSNSGILDSGETPSISAPKPPRSAAPTSSAGGGGGSGAIEGRGKVAYDPRDFENGGESQQMPRLTIMEEVLLLGLKDKAVSLTWGRQATEFPGIPFFLERQHLLRSSWLYTHRARSAEAYCHGPGSFAKTTCPCRPTDRGD